MPTTLEFKCPACSGALEFSPDDQAVKCPYCDTEFTVEAIRKMESEKDPSQENLQWKMPEEELTDDGLVDYVCQSCGGQILADENTAATSCPYCGNAAVMEKRLSGALKPDLLIPFQLDQQAAEQALKQHLTGKILLPKIFKDENRIRKIRGIYVPFWLFDADVDADLHFRATKVRHWSDSEYNYTETKHYAIHRAGSIGFDAVPVDGASKLDNDLMESIEPYDLSQAVPFEKAYLAGFLADKYDVSAEESQQRAQERIRTSTQAEFEATVVGYSTVRPQQVNLQLTGGQARYALLPVWLLNTEYKGQNYVFAMNGQTGRFVGDLPVDRGAFWKWFAIVAVAASALSVGIAYLIQYL